MAGELTVRKVDRPVGNGWPKKRMPVAERQQETETDVLAGSSASGISYNWPDTSSVLELERVLTWAG